MATGMSLASDRKRTGKIRALVIDQDLLICLDPCRFSVKQMASLAGMHSRRHRLVSSHRSLLLPDHPNAETRKSSRQLKVDALLDVHNRASAMPSALRQGLMP